jgi:hypothetical protein
MATVNTNDLRIKNAKNLTDSFNTATGDAEAYVFVGRVQPWADDNAPPVPQNNYKTFYDAYDDMFALKRVVDTDVYFMIPRLNWVTGSVYDYYRQDYTTENRTFSGAANLYDARFVVRNQQNNVYVCLNNDGNTPSTAEPLNTGNESFTTTDGYQWQRVYNLTAGVYAAYTTDNFMPIQENDVVVSTDGAVSTVIIENPGKGFSTNPIGAPNAIPFYYCGIDGDGTGAVAKVTVTGEVVTKVEVVRAGSGYTFGTLNFTANNTFESLADYDLNKNPLNPLGDGTLRTTVIIPPPGGWGTNLQRELGGTRVGVFSSLDYDLFNYFDGSFRQVGILQDMTVTGSSPTSVNACYAVEVDGLLTGETFISGEVIEQTITVDSVERKAKGVVISYDQTSGVIRYSQNSSNADVDGNLYRFTGTTAIKGLTSQLASDPTTTTGTVTGIPFTDGYSVPQITAYSGLMTYLANVSPVVRDPLQTERISLLIAF